MAHVVEGGMSFENHTSSANASVVAGVPELWKRSIAR